MAAVRGRAGSHGLLEAAPPVPSHSSGPGGAARSSSAPHPGREHRAQEERTGAGRDRRPRLDAQAML